MVNVPAALAAVAAVDGRPEAPAAAVAAAADATETTLAVEAAGEVPRNSDEHPTEGYGGGTATVYEPTSVAGVEAIPPAGAGGPPAAADPNISEAASGETPVAAVAGISAALGGKTAQGADEGHISNTFDRDRDRASRSSNWKQWSRPKKKFARRSPEECCLYCREPNHEFHECWDLWYLWFKHYTLKVPSWKKYLHSPELWKDPRIRGQVPPTWALPFSKSAAAKAKAAAVAARRRPVVDEKESQRAAEEDELPSSPETDIILKRKGETSHMDNDKQKKGKYTRSETTVTDGQASYAVSGVGDSFGTPDGRWIGCLTFGRASDFLATDGSEVDQTSSVFTDGMQIGGCFGTPDSLSLIHI